MKLAILLIAYFVVLGIGIAIGHNANINEPTEEARLASICLTLFQAIKAADPTITTAQAVKLAEGMTEWAQRQIT